MQAIVSQTTYQVVGVATQPNQPKGRGLKVKASAVKEQALKLGLNPVLEPLDLKKDMGFLKQFNELKPDLAVTAAYGRILSKEILTCPRLGCINVHFSLLPRLRGASPIESAILEGYSSTGVTIFWMDEAMDTGAILTQEQVPIFPQETALQLRQRLVPLGIKLLLESLRLIAAGKAPRAPQDHTLASYCQLIRKEDGQIHWQESADIIERKIRAFAGWPKCETTFQGKRLQILKAKVVENGPSKEALPGQIIRLERGVGFIIKCNKGSLLIEEVQPEGKRPMSAWAFLQGAPNKNAIKRLGRELKDE